MAEERIVFLKTKPKGECPCQIDKDYCKETCWVKGKCSLGMTRAEAIERMARAICRSGGNECIGDCESCDLWQVGPEKDYSEAALNALLGE